MCRTGDGDSASLEIERDGEECTEGFLLRERRCCWKKTIEKLVAVQGGVGDGGWWEACLRVF